jgi:hypothetical protein
VALFIKFQEAECETEVALEVFAGATAEAHVAGKDYEATAAALEPAMRALSLPQRGFSTACKCFT